MLMEALESEVQAALVAKALRRAVLCFIVRRRPTQEGKMTTFMSEQKGVPAHRKDMTRHVVPTPEVAGAPRRAA